jgi:hypothetical protein
VVVAMMIEDRQQSSVSGRGSTTATTMYSEDHAMRSVLDSDGGARQPDPTGLWRRVSSPCGGRRWPPIFGGYGLVAQGMWLVVWRSCWRLLDLVSGVNLVVMVVGLSRGSPDPPPLPWHVRVTLAACRWWHCPLPLSSHSQAV